MMKVPGCKRAASAWLAGIALGFFGSVRADAAGATVSLVNTNGPPGATLTLPVSLISSTPVVAAQFDLQMDYTRLRLETPQAGSALGDHQIASKDLAGGKWRVAVYSPANSAAGNGVMVQLPLTILANAPAGRAMILLTNVVLADAAGRRIGPLELEEGGVEVGSMLPARLQALTRQSNGIVQFNLIGSPGRAYVVEASSDLNTWTILSTNTVADGVAAVQDPLAAEFSRRFYRAKNGF